ncbi:malate synthase A [Niastella yeongjuensis]|uniref:malate synthase n=1 Tax=Niastella yeongjuensis TaxID=354355 RepID=A0A1V9F4V4_9BACT|nr:malate synthase A [Niastella yeongjuensis]OQP53424.1 malate synthase A [Niastella yeongjuensis]SEP12666.1 malate synthase [Niastella yeongjuensis]
MRNLSKQPSHDLGTAWKIAAPLPGAYENILTNDALQFLVELQRRFNQARKILLMERTTIQHQLNHGWKPHFHNETAAIREGDWTIAEVPADLLDRRVEITGPVERKMIINALNSGASIFMADFEDSNTPAWDNTIHGQINLKDAINRTISYVNENGKEYRLNEKTATMMVRPRGWHLEEKHILIDGEPVSASLVDFGLYFYHNARTLLQSGTGPYFYLPKLESYKEARLWNKVFEFAQDYCGIPQGTIKATVLVETILAVFQLHEILWELKEHSAGMNCGRWDYIFSFIKKFRNRQGYVFPDRAQVTMTVPCMRMYTQLVIQTCHKRQAHAIGGMAAQIPVRNDVTANEMAFEKVKADKLREVNDGHDGTWVAHPGLVPVALEIFNAHMPAANQLHRKREDFSCTEADLLQVPAGTVTEEGIRTNISIGILYLESWLRGNGAAAIYNCMEDAATAEISRTQLWQWLQNHTTLVDGRVFSQDLYERWRDEEIEKIKQMVGSLQYQQGQFVQAICLFNRQVVSDTFEEFLTLSAYDAILLNREDKACQVQLNNIEELEEKPAAYKYA